MTYYLILSRNLDGSIKEKRRITNTNATAFKNAKMSYMIISEEILNQIEEEKKQRQKEQEDLF